MMRATVLRFMAAAALVAVGWAGVEAQTGGDAALRVLPIRGNIFLISGAGGNVTMSIGKDGVLLVDSGSAEQADALLATVQEINRRVTAAPMPARSCVGVVRGCEWWSSALLLPTIGAPPAPKTISGIINTSADLDHLGGNEKVGGAGETFGVRNLNSTPVTAWIVAHENVTTRLSPGGDLKVPAAALPSEVYFGDTKKLNFVNGEGVVVTHIPAAHTDGDSIVHFRGSDVIAAGDLIDTTRYPVIDVERGGTIQGVVDGLNKLLDMMVVEHMMEGGTLVVPGHGRVMDSADVAYYRDMVTIMRDRVQEMRRRGMTLEQIKADKDLTRDYDPRFGRSAAWTPAMFLEAIYRTLGPNT